MAGRRIHTLAGRVAAWQVAHGRHGLPWQGSRDPYRVWLSEIMLQQTQVDTVLGYYSRFLQRFPTVQSLAAASLDEVMPFWAGLGYYTRARNLHRCARMVMDDYGGQFPSSADDLLNLPGIGRSTAAAIAAFAFGERRSILDGNVKRVLCRVFGIEGDPASGPVEKKLWALAESIVHQAPASLDMTAYTQGLMDLGATRCTRGGKPLCELCPLRDDCHAQHHSRQAELPWRRARKALPEREKHFLIALSPQAVLLERQPSRGIWANLWSLPAQDDAGMVQALAGRIGAATPAVRLATLTHTFSHYRLQMHPWLLELPQQPLAEPSADSRWVAWQDIHEAALPAPVEKLLKALMPAAS